MSKKASVKRTHTASTQRGMGDHYGVGVRNKVGTMRDGHGINAVKPSKLKKAPKSLA